MRIFFFLIVSASAFLTPFWVFLIIGTLYAFWYRSWELCLLGLVIDVVFGGDVGIFPYVYTIGTCMLIVLMKPLKQYLSVYNHTNGV